MARNLKKLIIIVILFFSIICFIPRKVELPDYDDVVISVLKREPNNEMLMELTEQEKTELYVLLDNVKGIYMPEMFAEYINQGRISYEISISTKNGSSNDDLRFCILIGFNGQVDHASYRYILKSSYKFIINADDLANFLKNL